MRGGARKGLFVLAGDLPATARARDALLCRALGGPDPSGRQLDGLGGGHPDTSRVAVVARSSRPGADIDVSFGVLPPNGDTIDWGEGCLHLIAAVGPFAIDQGLFPARDGIVRVRIRVTGTDARVDAFVPVHDGEAIEEGVLRDAGVPFGAAEIRLEWLDPALDALPTGTVRDRLEPLGLDPIEATLIHAATPTAFLRAEALGLSGRETPGEIDRNRRLLERVEAVRKAAALRLGLPAHAPVRVAWIGKPMAYRPVGGPEIPAEGVDLLVRSVRAGLAERDGGDDGAVGVAVAVAVPGTVPGEVARTLPGVPTRIGHAAGTLAVGAEVHRRERRVDAPRWEVSRCTLSRTARRLMVGELFPGEPG